MPELILEETDYAGPIPEDKIFAAEVTGIKVVKRKKDTPDEYERMEFAFVLRDPEGKWDGQRIWGDTPTTFNTHPDCRLRAWAQEMLGSELDPGFRLNTDDLVGMECRVVIGERRYTKDNQEKVHNFVKDVFRAKGGQTYAADEEPF